MSEPTGSDGARAIGRGEGLAHEVTQGDTLTVSIPRGGLVDGEEDDDEKRPEGDGFKRLSLFHVVFRSLRVL